MTRLAPGPAAGEKADRYYCPYCSATITDDYPYFHAYEHRDKGPYAHLVAEEMWPAGLAAHCFAEGIQA